MDEILLAELDKERKRSADLNPLDLLDGRKKIRSILRTPEGREALRRELGYSNLRFAGEALEDGRPLISLLCPSRHGYEPMTGQAVYQMLQTAAPFCLVTTEPGVSLSVVHWARNDLFVNLKKSGHPADFVLLIDDDMVPEPDALIKLLAHATGERALDIVAGFCTVRTDPPMPNFRRWVPERYTFETALDWLCENGTKEGLLEVGSVGAAFMLVRTTVLDKIGEYHLSCRYEREHLGLSGEQADKLEQGRRKTAAETGNEWWFEFMKHPWGAGEWGEDISFCFKARECGFHIFVDTTVCPGHIGPYPFGKADYLAYQKEVIERQKAKRAREPIKIQARIEEEEAVSQ